MASTPRLNGEAKAFKRDVSKLVAVPNIPQISNRPSKSVSTLPSPLIVSSNSDVQNGTNASAGSTAQIPSMHPKYLHSPDDIETKIFKTTVLPEQANWSYDVYANPFVPRTLKAINLEPASIIPTRPQHWIDFQDYIQTFAGSSFLPHRPPNTLEMEDTSLVLSDAPLDESSYLRYLSASMQIEKNAKKGEHEAYALYKVPLYSIQTTSGTVWALSVPGLRDDRPFIEMGDVLQIRQLWVDVAGNLLRMQDQTMAYNTYMPAIFKCWTGVQYDAAVQSVNRADEIVYVKADGLRLWDVGHVVLPMGVNVIFPPKNGLLQAQQNALINVSAELKQAAFLQNRGDAVDLNGKNESIGAAASESGPQEEAREPRNDWIRRMLFPIEADGRLQTKLRNIPHRPLFDHAINYEQAHAVNDVCINEYGTLPYLISGPPGTGKTKSLVEITLQLLNTNNATHVIICAPSEAAADTLALRLKLYLSVKQMLRLNRPGRADKEVPQGIIQYCYFENDMFRLPPFKQLMSYNVIVTSCRDATILTEARLTNKDIWTIEREMLSAFRPEDKTPIPSLHWGALLIDEAAQATEVDILPAISVVCPLSTYPPHLPQPRFVMAGDENQLGPRTASLDSRISTSLFARLLERPLYKAHPLARSNVKPSSGPPVLKRSMLPIIYPPFTLLIRNYRSHPAILSVPSAIFYHDTLIPEVQTLPSPLHDSSLWCGRKWPVLFVPHAGADEIERDGGGWYNISEARVACGIAQKLVRESAVEQSDICIMSPFAAQVKLLRSLMRSEKFGEMWKVNIGPLEAFQGLENRVVIICTTRTRCRFLDEDQKRGLGIVHQKRKMNVALTRAKEALVVIGNAEVLRQDEHWRQWLAFCGRNGLVADDEDVLKGILGPDEVPKIGVLERALIAKEAQLEKAAGPALGAGAAQHDINGNADYEAWLESLREALEEEEEEDEDDAELETDDTCDDDVEGGADEAVEESEGEAEDDEDKDSLTVS